MDEISLSTLARWLLLGPVSGLLISFGSWFVLDYISPDKLSSINEITYTYPKGLLMSLLTPWGWLMYGGAILMHSEKPRRGVICTSTGAVILGLFWPVWATFMLDR